MPAIANITVKKNDGTTDIIYAALTPSSGDTTAARYRQDTGNALPPGFRQGLSIKTRDNGPKTARVAEIHFSGPFTYTDTNGNTASTDQVIFETRAVIPQKITQLWIDEMVSQYVNLLASAAVKDQLKVGFAAT